MNIMDPKIAKMLLFPVLAAAFWPVWLWYYRNFTSLGGDLTTLIPLVPIVLFLIFKMKNNENQAWDLSLPLLLITAYILGYHWLPPLGRAVIAVTAASAFGSGVLGKKFIFSFWGLSMLTLPVIPTLQFFVGFPLRVIVASIAVVFLRMNGLPVIREGVLLNWCGRLVAVDAPCSGIQMLWAGFLLIFTLLLFLEIPIQRSLIYTGLTIFLIILGNALRIVALFYTEMKIITLPSWSHRGIGMSSFGFCGVILIVLVLWCEKRMICQKS